jgi:hypothetical protein
MVFAAALLGSAGNAKNFVRSFSNCLTESLAFAKIAPSHHKAAPPGR